MGAKEDRRWSGRKVSVAETGAPTGLYNREQQAPNGKMCRKGCAPAVKCPFHLLISRYLFLSSVKKDNLACRNC